MIYLYYKNSSDVEYSKRLDMKTAVISIIDKLTEMIESQNNIVNVQVGMFRLEIKDFPIHVFQEALINAISHRNFKSMGAIYVRHYPDKIVIENPGSLPEGITMQNIITHAPIARNKLIAETFQRMKFAQRAGQGVDIIFRDTLAWGKPLPVYNSYEDSLRLTIYSSLEDKDFVHFIAKEQDTKQFWFGTSEIILLYYLKENKSIDLKQAILATQSDSTETRIALNKLIDRGYVERSGRKYNFSFSVYKSLGIETGYIVDKELEYAKAKGRIVDYIETKGFITNPLCQKLCGYDERKSRYVLNKLAKDNIIVKVGDKKNTKYILPEGTIK